MSNPYIVNFTNNSTNSGYACVFQENTAIGVPNVLSLAWQSQQVNASGTCNLSWNTTYDFFWGVPIVPAAVTAPYYQTYEILPAVITGSTLTNETTLAYNGAYEFTTPLTAGTTGSLTILLGSTLPAGNNTLVGIGMSGAAAFAVPAATSASPLIFTPIPAPVNYYVTFGPYPPGAVLNLSELFVQALPITFPAGGGTIDVTLSSTNVLSVNS